MKENNTTFSLYTINEWLATHGLEPQFGSELSELILQPDTNNMIIGFTAFDIRERLPDAPTDLYIYRRIVNEAAEIVKDKKKIVICCSAGVSRSNSIAIALLMRHTKMSFERALILVKEKVPIADPLPCHLEKIKMLE